MSNTIFSPTYWKEAWGELKKLRRLTFAALVCALSIVIGAFYVMVGENLRVYFTFFITAVGAAVYGPVVAVLVAAVTDTLNFLLFPSGAYFPGYLLSEMLAGLIYALFLYRKKITVLRLFGAKFCVNYFINVLLGCTWSQILFGKGYLYYLVKSLVKNTLLLPMEVLLLCILFSALIPVFSRLGMLPAHEDRELRRLTLTASIFPILGLDCILGGCASFYFSTTIESGIPVFQGIAIGLSGLGIFLLLLGQVYHHRNSRDT